jgi:hypothetical protein
MPAIAVRNLFGRACRRPSLLTGGVRKAVRRGRKLMSSGAIGDGNIYAECRRILPAKAALQTFHFSFCLARAIIQKRQSRSTKSESKKTTWHHRADPILIKCLDLIAKRNNRLRMPRYLAHRTASYISTYGFARKLTSS